MPAESTSKILDVYRQPAAPSSKCAECRAPAFARCQRCGRLLCLDHMPVGADERCTDCELLFSRLRRRIDTVQTAFVAPIIVLLPIALVAYFHSDLWEIEGWRRRYYSLIYDGNILVGLSITALAVAAVVLVGAMVRRVFRYRFLRQGGYEQLLGEWEVPIAPRSERNEQPVDLIRSRKVSTWCRTYYGGGSNPRNV